MSTFDFDEVVEQYQRGLGEFVKGNPEPNKRVFSHREDVTLANPLGPAVRGWEQVAATMEAAASLVREEETVAFKNVAKYLTPEYAESSSFRERSAYWKSEGQKISPS